MTSKAWSANPVFSLKSRTPSRAAALPSAVPANTGQGEASPGGDAAVGLHLEQHRVDAGDTAAAVGMHRLGGDLDRVDPDRLDAVIGHSGDPLADRCLGLVQRLADHVNQGRAVVRHGFGEDAL